MPLLTRPGARPALTSAVLTAVVASGTPRRLALGRTAAGLAMLLRPRLLPGVLGVDSATGARMAWSTSMLGAREVALGVGTLAALRAADRGPARLWIAAGALCDAVDVLAIGAAAVRGRVSRAPGGAIAVSAAAAVVMGVYALSDDDEK